MIARARRYGGVVLAALLATAAHSGTASAAIYEYVYSGNVLRDESGTPAPAPYERFSGDMWVDESQVPGGTLVNATFSGEFSFPDSWDSIPWLEKFTIWPAYPSPPSAFAALEFTTDADRNIVSWDIEISDGPPDFDITDTGDRAFFSGDPEDEEEYFAAPGTWSEPTVIPVPAALLLLLSAVATIPLGAFASRLARRDPAA
jgi:hypothetical protein